MTVQDESKWTYPNDDLHNRLMTAMKTVYPGFSNLMLLVSGPTGTGKSFVAASFPVLAGKTRYFGDSEDSMKFVDGGKDCVDYYAPRRYRFHMTREKMPDMATYLKMYQALCKFPDKLGVFGFDNIAVLQDTVYQYLINTSGNPAEIRGMWKAFNVAHLLPVDTKIRKWGTAQRPEPEFWTAAKAIPYAFLMACLRLNINFIGTTEESNVWTNYGSSDAKVVGKKAKLWDVWLRYTDGVITLQRDPNPDKATGLPQPPTGYINTHNPKMRIQGLNPKWVMDWPHFIAELEVAAKREAETIPPEATAPTEILVEGPTAEELAPLTPIAIPAAVELSDNGKSNGQI